MTAIWWIRRDLRLQDNLALQKSMEAGPILPVFILDQQLLASTPVRKRNFLFNGLRSLDADLRSRSSYLVIRSGNPDEVLRRLLKDSAAQVIYAEEDFTPYAVQRDRVVAARLPAQYIQGQIVHHPKSVRKKDGKPYTVYTPFRKTWLKMLPGDLNLAPAPAFIPTIPGIPSDPFPETPQVPNFPASEDAALERLVTFLQDKIHHYTEHRNRMDIDGTALLSPYIHFGMLGLRTAVRHAYQIFLAARDNPGRKSAETWLHELIWREFYIHILYHFPEVRRRSFRSQYDQIRWQNDLDDFAAWKEGRTGYPIVDAAMRQMLATGWMHNRARMIVASFLVKDLLIDWRWGESWFMQQLLDGDLAANNGGWQWTAGTGTDAAPYFRIFNPILQSKKFDPHGDYIRKWVPELAHLDSTTIHAPWEKKVEVPGYPTPIVDHKYARESAIAAYREV